MPGFPPACPEFYDCSFDVWVTMAAILMYVVFAEVALLALSAVNAHLRQRKVGGALNALALVSAGAFSMIACVAWLSQIGAHMIVAPFTHYSPLSAAHARQVAIDKLSHILGLIGVLIVVCVISTAITASTLIRSSHT